MQKIYKMLVADKPGVLDRIVGIIRRYGVNISFLLVFATESPGVSLLIMKIRDGAVDNRLTERLREIDAIFSIDILEDQITEQIIQLGK